MGNRNRPASENGQMSRSESVIEAVSPASRRRGVRSVLIEPQTMIPVAAPAQRLATTAIVGERPKTVATSTKGPVIWSGSLCM
jgi:hypothetical protein